MSNCTIWKAVLKPQDTQVVKMPAGAEILCAREQHEQICIWFRCDPTAPESNRDIAIVGTGQTAPAGWESRYLGSAALMGGNMMFHVFERRAS